MKKLVIVVIAVLFSVSAIGQISRQTKKQIKALEKEIKSVKKDISKLERSMPRVYYPDAIKDLALRINSLKTALESDSTLTDQEGARIQHDLRGLDKLYVKYSKKNAKTQPASIKAKIAVQDKRLSFLENKRDSILNVYATNPGYVELTDISRNRRQNALTVRRGELALNKLANTPIKADSVKGYEGVIKNLSQYTKCTFVIKSTSSYGETVSFFLGAGAEEHYNLLPGTYVCEVFARGVKIGTHTFEVSPQQHRVLGETVHWAVYREGY